MIRSKYIFLLSFWYLFNASCASTAPSTSVTSKPDTIETKTTIYQPKLGERIFPLWVSDIEIAGISSRFMIDSGSTHHVISEHCVEKSFKDLLVIEDTIAGTSSTGASVQMKKVTSSLVARIGGFVSSTDTWLVTNMPPVFNQLGICGILAPQLLGDFGIKLDFNRSEIVSSDLKSVGGLRRCEDGRYEIEVVVDEEKKRLLVDSGSVGTTISLETSETGSTKVESGAVDIQGNSQGTKTKRKFSIGIADKDIQLEVNITVTGHGGSCGTDGMLGMDALGQLPAMSFQK